MGSADIFQWLTGIGAWGAVGCGIRLIFICGRIVERQDDHGKRIERLERWRDTAKAQGD